MALFKVSTYEDAKKQLKVFLDTLPQLPIYLLGSGNNGKTKLTTELTIDIEKAERTIYREEYKKKPDFHDLYEVNTPSNIVSPAYVLDMNNIKF